MTIMTPRVVPLAATLVFTLAACGEGGRARPKDGPAGDAAATVGCVGADTTALRLAVLEYITTASPRPQRFLSAFGTDSALPDDGFRALQDTGPTYFYNDDPKNQAQVKSKLASAGPYVSMLVVYKGQAESDGGTRVTVTLGGHYVGGEDDGKPADVRQITVRCDSTRWRLQK